MPKLTLPLCLLLVLTVDLYAQSRPQTWVVGGAGGQPWRQALDRWIGLDDSARTDGSVQPLEVPRGQTVTRQAQTAGLASHRFNFLGYRWVLYRGPLQLEADTLTVGWYPRMWNGGAANALASPIMAGLVDGDVLASGFTHAATVDGRPNGITYFTMDLGVAVPVDSVVFYPPQSGLTGDGQRQRELFARAYEVSRQETPVEWLIFEDETIATGSSGYHPLEDILGSTFANNTGVVSLTGELQFTRFLRFKFGGVTTTTLVAEVEAFGRGYPKEARYVSAVHSFGQPVSLGEVTYRFTTYRQAPSGEIFADPDAPVRLTLRTRAGTDAEPKAFFVFNELGRMLEVDAPTYFGSPGVQEQFSQGIAGFRAARVDDTVNWNNWSVPYTGSGEQLRSSDGRQYLQFRFEITTDDPLAFGVLDSVAFEASPLLADSVVAEISLPGVDRAGAVEVPLGVDTVFVYDIRTVAGARLGFDGIELDVPASARFLDLEIDGALAAEGADFEVVRDAGSLRFLFPRVYAADAEFRLRFRSAIYQSSVFLEGRLFNTDPASNVLPQSIEAGDARADVASDGLQVIAGDARLNVLGKVVLASPVVTPNGDRVNDEALVHFDLYGVEAVALRVEVLDLAGRRVALLLDAAADAGPVDLRWDAAGAGQTVPPGLYLIRVEVDVDQGTLTRVQPLAVAY